MTSDQPSDTIDALALLSIPSLDTLTEYQVRGITCVWDAARLINGVAVDLGARKAQRAGQPISWYPRACRSCVGVAAMFQLGHHTADCPTCLPDEDTWCDTGNALRQLMRENQR